MSSVIVNLGLLGSFKYTDSLLEAVDHAAGTQTPLLDLALPIRVSFYTSQTMSYTTDVYRGKMRVQKSITSFGAYVSIFPQLVTGLIVRYSAIAEELDERQESYEVFGDGIACFINGLEREVLLINTIGAPWMET